GDKVRLAFDMPVKLIEANPRVHEDYGRIAVQRGPLVYCLERVGSDQPFPFDISLALDEDPTDDFTPEFRPDLLGGVTVIRAKAVAARTPHSQEPLYRELDQRGFPEGKQVEVTLIPYYSWANRGPSEMEVWLPWTRKEK
ncbi:MAG: glycoside hydrolase family 127 protein, partial [Acidobacteria bacterium]|nr:glycoside hydrolase family 127 protein [Acidobacteriota bacterium]